MPERVLEGERRGWKEPVKECKTRLKVLEGERGGESFLFIAVANTQGQELNQWY